jgi:hypothetical protein
MPIKTVAAPATSSIFDDDDDGWQDMPIIRDSDVETSGLDEEDRKKYHYVSKSLSTSGTGTDGGGKPVANATGHLLDYDEEGNDWRSKGDDVVKNESEYTRLRGLEEEDVDEVHMRTKYLFDEDKAMTPLSQMQATKELLTEAQRIAYVGVCSLVVKEMIDKLKGDEVDKKTGKKRKLGKEIKESVKSMEIWTLKIMGRLYYHMELETKGVYSYYLGTI